MKNYLSVSGRLETEVVIEKSRFITNSAHVESEEEAKNFIAEISYKYRDATHNCYAYICDATGNFMRFSDDGEPQGTAGMPMLEVIKAKSLVQTAVVVTRYFGGIKLGAGGLVRAYSGSVAKNLAEADIVSYELCCEGEYIADYAFADGAKKFFDENDCTVCGINYDDRVRFTVAVRDELSKDFDARLINRLNGRISLGEKRRYFYPFSVKS